MLKPSDLKNIKYNKNINSKLSHKLARSILDREIYVVQGADCRKTIMAFKTLKKDQTGFYKIESNPFVIFPNNGLVFIDIPDIDQESIKQYDLVVVTKDPPSYNRRIFNIKYKIGDTFNVLGFNENGEAIITMEDKVSVPLSSLTLLKSALSEEDNA